MSRVNFGAKPVMYPMPVLIIATYDENGANGIKQTVACFILCALKSRLCKTGVFCRTGNDFIVVKWNSISLC